MEPGPEGCVRASERQLRRDDCGPRYVRVILYGLHRGAEQGCHLIYLKAEELEKQDLPLAQAQFLGMVQPHDFAPGNQKIVRFHRYLRTGAARGTGDTPRAEAGQCIVRKLSARLYGTRAFVSRSSTSFATMSSRGMVGRLAPWGRASHQRPEMTPFFGSGYSGKTK